MTTVELFYLRDSSQLSAQIAGIPPGQCLICCIILWTGDYPAQSEVGKIINKGIRRCEVKGVTMLHVKHNNVPPLGERYPGTTQYYFGNFRYRNRNPWPKRIFLEKMIPQ